MSSTIAVSNCPNDAFLFTQIGEYVTGWYIFWNLGVCLIVNFAAEDDLPDYINWVEAGAVTPVMDQAATGKIDACVYNWHVLILRS